MNKLGLIAGADQLPLKVVDYCTQNKIELFCVLITPFAKKENYKNQHFIEISIGQIGKAIKYFKKNNITDLVCAGAVKKPSFGLMKMDLKGLLLLNLIIKNKILGDNTVLETIIKFLNKYNLNLIALDDILPDIKLNKNNNTKINITNDQLIDIELGTNILKTLSNFDIGQSIVIQQKNVIGIECVEGTQNLILRSKELKYTTGSKPILIKIKKINQTKKIDLPTIGINTIEQIYQAGFAGIAIDYKHCIVIDREKVLNLANKYKLFIYGIE